MICDVSQYQGSIDLGQLRSTLDFAILRSSVGPKQDTRYREYVSGCTRYGIPYHAYHYIKATTEAEARNEAKVMADACSGTSPLFYVIDAEYNGIKASDARRICEAFEDGLRHYIANDIRVAVYIGHHLYRSWALDYSRYAYVWIPRYGKNSGQPETRPDYPCDLWQYTSKGRLTGIEGDVDLDMLTGSKPMEFFTGGKKVSNPYDKYIYSTSTHWISNSGSDERGQYHGGQAGDQGKEWCLKAWYSRPWLTVLRWPDIRVGLRIADLACAAALNNNIGYDQYQRTTYWTQLQAAGYDPSKIVVPCEEDCTSGVTADVKAVGVLMGIPALSSLPIDTYSANMCKRFVAAGFEALTASKYLKSPDYLLPGDILLYDGHHAATNVTYGAKVRPSNPVDITPPTTDVVIPGISLLGTRILRRGNAGADVEQLQKALMSLGYDVGSWGADGDFGAATERAVRDFQRDHGLEVDGEFGPKSLAALKAALSGDEPEQPEPPAAQTARYVEITGGTVNIRSAPGTDSRILGVAYEGEKLPYQGEMRQLNGIDWYLVEYNNENAWVSGKYSRLMEG